MCWLRDARPLAQSPPRIRVMLCAREAAGGPDASTNTTRPLRGEQSASPGSTPSLLPDGVCHDGRLSGPKERVGANPDRSGRCATRARLSLGGPRSSLLQPRPPWLSVCVRVRVCVFVGAVSLSVSVPFVTLLVWHLFCVCLSVRLPAGSLAHICVRLGTLSTSRPLRCGLRADEDLPCASRQGSKH